MGSPAARVGDIVRHDTPHCHAAIHGSPRAPAPLAHAPQSLGIITGSPDVKIGGQPSVRQGDQTAPCIPAGCVPGGPGQILIGSATVKINGKAAARAGDVVLFAGCAGPIPCTTAKVVVGSSNVNIG